MFIVHSLPRTGTYLMSSALNSHPNITCLDEIMLRDAGTGTPFDTKTIEEYLSELEQEHQNKRWGFTLHPQQVNEQERDCIADHCDKVIFVYRRNFLKQLCSIKIARRKRIWLCNKENDNPIRISVNPERAIKHFNLTAQLIEESRKFWVARCPVMEFTYVDLCKKFENIIIQILAFLDVRPFQCMPSTHRQESRELEQIITNYKELYQALSKTKWVEFFNPEF